MSILEIDWLNEDWPIEIVYEKPEGEWTIGTCSTDEIKLDGHFVRIVRKDSPDIVHLIPIARVYRISQTRL